MQHIPLEVQHILTQFYNELKGISPGFPIGLYITGSLVLNDFHSDKSDIDFVVVCHDLALPDLQGSLTKIHKRIAGNHKATLNGVYLTQDHLRLKHSNDKTILRFQENRVEEVLFEMAPIILYELKTSGEKVNGLQGVEEPDIQVDMNDVAKFLFRNINSYWKNWIDDHSSLFKKKLLLILFPRLTEWGVLGVARQYYTLMTGRITSKTAAGQFLQPDLAMKHQSIVREAISIRSNTQHILPIQRSYSISPSLARANATITCMKEIIFLFNQAYASSDGKN